MHLHRRPPWPAASSILWPSTPIFRTKLKERLIASSETVSPNFLTGRICPISKQFIERSFDLAHPYLWAFHIDLWKTMISRDILFPKVSSDSCSNRFHQCLCVSAPYDDRHNCVPKYMANFFKSFLSWEVRTYLNLKGHDTWGKRIPWSFYVQTWKISWWKWQAQGRRQDAGVWIRAEVPFFFHHCKSFRSHNGTELVPESRSQAQLLVLISFRS